MAKPDEFNSAKGHNCWFEERWGEADEWNKTFLEEVLKGTPIDLAQPSVVNSPLTPYELYIKLLHHQFVTYLFCTKNPHNYVPLLYNIKHEIIMKTINTI